jgi:hypothetical protein
MIRDAGIRECPVIEITVWQKAKYGSIGGVIGGLIGGAVGYAKGKKNGN